jgi:hypothetical protein
MPCVSEYDYKYGHQLSGKDVPRLRFWWGGLGEIEHIIDINFSRFPFGFTQRSLEFSIATKSHTQFTKTLKSGTQQRPPRLSQRLRESKERLGKPDL